MMKDVHCLCCPAKKYLFFVDQPRASYARYCYFCLCISFLCTPSFGISQPLPTHILTIISCLPKLCVQVKGMFPIESLTSFLNHLAKESLIIYHFNPSIISLDIFWASQKQALHSCLQLFHLFPYCVGAKGMFPIERLRSF